MRGMTAWTLVVILSLMVLNTGCEQPKKDTTPAAAPAPAPMPEAAVQPTEPQPAPGPAANTPPPPPPVDSTAEKTPAANHKAKSKQQPKESYAHHDKKGARTYVVKKGDTLQKISEHFYGTTKNWEKICKANKLKDCNDLEPGTKLVIP